MKNDERDLLKGPSPDKYSKAAIKVVSYKFPPYKRGFSLHWHDIMEVLHIKKGQIKCDYGTESAVGKAGEVMLIPPGTLHSGLPLDEGVEYDVLMFDVRYFYNDTPIGKELLPALYDGRAVLKYVVSDSEAVECVKKICDSRGLQEFEIMALVYKFLGLTFKYNLLELRRSPKNVAIQKIVEYLEEHFDKELTLEGISREFGYTTEHLCRKFKQATGTTPMGYLKIYRLEWASDRLRSGDGFVSEIAAACGFGDANYFTRCFKSHFGKAPTEFRKEETDLYE